LTVLCDSVRVVVVETGWTLAELAGRVAQALAAADVRSPNGRVTEMPDGRVIRWYATIGLVDRPSGMRGRTALYGQRHLLQLVAIKRRQAQGRSLAEIQAELAGATDATLRSVAAVPAEMFGGFTALRDAAPDTVGSRRFWAQPASVAAMSAAERGSAAAQGGAKRGVAERGAADGDGVLHGGTLGTGTVLLLPAAPTDADVGAIRAAARPLLDLLAARGLLTTPGEGA